MWGGGSDICGAWASLIHIFRAEKIRQSAPKPTVYPRGDGDLFHTDF